MLVAELIRCGHLKTPEIINAFCTILRKDFIPPELKHLAEENIPISIGYHQTNSQPLVVAFMLELLEPRGKILDVGSGSGWTSALLSLLCDEVWSLERIPELLEFAKDNCKKYNLHNIEFVLNQDQIAHLPAGKVDRILVSATAVSKHDFKDLFLQLKSDGVMVAPIGQSIWKFWGNQEIEYPGYTFVPFVSPSI